MITKISQKNARGHCSGFAATVPIKGIVQNREELVSYGKRKVLDASGLAVAMKDFNLPSRRAIPAI